MSNTEGLIVSLLVLAVVFAPFLVSVKGKEVRGNGAWKVMTFLLCGLAVAAGFTMGVPLGLLLWVLAWICCGAALSSARKEVQAEALIEALQKQNELLRRSQP